METFRPFRGGSVFFCLISAQQRYSPDKGEVSCSLLTQARDAQRQDRQIRLLTYGTELIWVAPRLHRPIIGDVVAFFVPKIP